MFANDGPTTPPSQSVQTQAVEALEARLAFLEKQIEQLVRLAPTFSSEKEQDGCWERAFELQKEARLTRQAISRLRKAD